MNISWFMRGLNEPIARDANREDDCTDGRPPRKFFEARFKSQALLGDQALITCMAYVDLNPVRAGIAETPETSDFTSIKKRIEAAEKGGIPKQLARFQGNEVKQEKPHPIPFTMKDYIDLVEDAAGQVGRAVHPKKRGYIASDLPPIFKRLKISPEEWTDLALNFEKHFTNWIGSDTELEQVCERKGMRHVHGSPVCQPDFEPSRSELTYLSGHTEILPPCQNQATPSRPT